MAISIAARFPLEKRPSTLWLTINVFKRFCFRKSRVLCKPCKHSALWDKMSLHIKGGLSDAEHWLSSALWRYDHVYKTPTGIGCFWWVPHTQKKCRHNHSHSPQGYIHTHHERPAAIETLSLPILSLMEGQCYFKEQYAIVHKSLISLAFARELLDYTVLSTLAYTSIQSLTLIETEHEVIQSSSFPTMLAACILC